MKRRLLMRLLKLKVSGKYTPNVPLTTFFDKIWLLVLLQSLQFLTSFKPGPHCAIKIIAKSITAIGQCEPTAIAH